MPTILHPHPAPHSRPSLAGWLLLTLTLGLVDGRAQVEHKKEWQPVRTRQAVAPEPTRLEARLKAFEARNSPSALAVLAEEFFGLLNPDYQPESAAQAETYRQAFAQLRAGRHADALESYRRFFFERLRHPPTGFKVKGLDPTKRTFIEFFNEADRLMKGEFILAAFDRPMPDAVEIGGVDSILGYYRSGKHNAHMINLVLKNGGPGRMNWTHQPEGIWGPTVHLPTGPAFVGSSYNKDMVFAPLLAAYVEKRDPRYLARWSEYVDDYLLNYRQDLSEAGIRYDVEWGGAGGPNFGHLAYLVTEVSETDRDLPAATFIRFLKNKWLSDLPLHIRGTRAAGPNRIMHMYGFLLLENYLNFPELECAEYLLRERRRCLEWYARACVNPDGTGIDYAPNYNKNYIIWPTKDYDVYRGMKQPPAWATKSWRTEILETQLDMARYLIRDFAPGGGKPGFKNVDADLRSEYFNPNSFISQFLPEAWKNEDNVRVGEMLMGRGAAAEPSFRSEAYPYGGYYFFRENWSPDAQFAYFHSYRPGSSGAWRFNQNLQLQAFGQKMLSFYTEESPLLVDGCGQIHAGDYERAPRSYRDDEHGLHYGRYQANMAWLKPLPHRWTSSDRFDFAEGTVTTPYMETYVDRDPTFIDDVSHGRQVLFLRGVQAWIVTDRVQSRQPHAYQLRWGLHPDRSVPEGWVKANPEPPVPAGGKGAVRPIGYAKTEIIVDADRQVLRTASPGRPNLSIFHAATTPLEFRPGDITQAHDKFGNAYLTGPHFRSDRTAVVASLLYPRKDLSTDLRQFTPQRGADWTGFEVTTTPGNLISYRASVSARELQAGEARGQATVLVQVTRVDGEISGIALDCRKLEIRGRMIASDHSDFEYVLRSDGEILVTPIYRPLELVRISPEADAFVDGTTITLSHERSDVDIRYTLDGSDPSDTSPRYAGPLVLRETTWVKARAFRRGMAAGQITPDGVRVSARQSALFTRTAPLAPQVPSTGDRRAGLAYRYFEDDWTLSAIKLPLLKPMRFGVARDPYDLSGRAGGKRSFALVYDGFLEVKDSGVYTLHAPPEWGDYTVDMGYDLRLFLDGREWYPSTRRHNYGGWTLPLLKGSHSLQVVFIDQRPGDKEASKGWNNVMGDWMWKGDAPQLELSGPGLPRQRIPAAWLWHDSRSREVSVTQASTRR